MPFLFSSSVVSLIIYPEIISVYRKVARREQRLLLFLPSCYTLLHVLCHPLSAYLFPFSFLKKNLSILAVLGLLAARKLSLVVMSGAALYLWPAGFSLWWFLLLQSTCSRHTGLVAPRHVGSSQARDWTRVPCIGRLILTHHTTWEVPSPLSFISLQTFWEEAMDKCPLPVTGMLFWTLTHQAPLSMGFSRREYWYGFSCPPPGDLSKPGMEPCLLCLLYWQAGSLPLAPPGEAQ